MKVVILSWEYPPRIIGGLGRHVYHLSQALARIGVIVRVVTCGFPDAPPRETFQGVQVTRVDCDSTPHIDQLLWTYNMNRLMIEEGQRILEEEQHDLIHAHDWMVARAAFRLRNQYHIPLVTTIHATEKGRAGVLYTPHKKTIHSVEQLLARYSDRVICCSSFMQHHLEETFELDASRVDIIPNGIDPSELESFQGPDGWPPGSPRGMGKTVLYVGRMVREKGVHTLIEGFEAVLRTHNGVRLILVGEGPVKEALIHEVQRRGIADHVQFTGYVDQQTLIGLYKTSDIFVLPSHYEPFGMAVLEAMASGLPVVVSDAGGLSEIVEDHITGLKVQPGNAQSLAEAISLLLDNGALANLLTRNAQRLIREKYDWNLVAEKTIAAYRRAVEDRVEPDSIPDGHFLNEQSALYLLFSLGAGKRETARSSSDLASLIGAPENEVNHLLGRLISQGYVSTFFPHESSARVLYHLSGTGLIKSHAGFS